MELNVREKQHRSYIKNTIWVILIVTSICLIGSSIWYIIENEQIWGPVRPADIQIEYIALILTSILLILISILGTINSTLTQENILNNFTRAKIYSLIEAQPGIHFSQIRRSLKLGKGQADWHLYNLRRFELITQVRSEQYLLFYPTSVSDIDVLARHSTIFKSDTREEIFNLISSGNATTQNQIKKHLQMSQSSIAYHLGILESENLIFVVRKGRIRHYYPTSDFDNNQSLAMNEN